MDNFYRLMKAFKKFGLPTDGILKDDFLNVKEFEVFTFGRPPVSIDIMTSTKGLKFDDVFKSSEINVNEGFPIRVISYSYLLASKRASGRLRDMSDISHLEEE